MHKKESKILTAAKLNKFDELRKILEKFDKAKTKRKIKGNIDIDFKDSSGVTALHYAAKNDNEEMMSYLVSRGADIESMDINGWRPISYACAHNNIKAVKTLILWRSSVNSYSLMEENSPLHIAAGFGYVDIVKLLMENGAIVYHQNKSKKTPMDVACESNHYGVVNVLLQASSKLVDDSSQRSSALSYLSSPLTSPLLRSSLYIKQPSIGSTHHLMSRLKSSFNASNESEFKRRTIGSQSQLCKPMDLPKPKKSGSLNTIYPNNYVFEDSDERFVEKKNVGFVENKSACSEIEISLPYPSKFSTSEKLKIKSPLLTAKNFKFNDKGRRNNPSVIDFNFDRVSTQFRYPNDVSPTPSISSRQDNQTPTDNNSLMSKHQLDTRSLSNPSPMDSPTSPILMSSFKPHLSFSSNSSYDIDSKLKFNQRKSQSMGREFGSESDIKCSPLKSPKQTKQQEILRPTLNKTCLQSAQDNGISSQTIENMCNGNSYSENEEYTCSKWIKSIGLERIWNTLQKEGFDSFLSLSLATNDQLLLLCDSNIADWDTLKQNLDLLNIPSLSMLKFSDKISDLLYQLGLECYVSNFLVNGFHFVQQMIGFNDSCLNKLQIVKIGHRRLLLECLSILHKTLNLFVECSPDTTSLDRSSQQNAYGNVSGSSYSPNFENREELLLLKNNDQTDINPHIALRNPCSESNKRLPPPIPFRSSSIISTDESKNLTLNDILETSNPNENDDLTKKEVHGNNTSNNSCLDDIVNLLMNLGKELDDELNNI